MLMWMPTQTVPRLQALTGVRILAATVVFLSHLPALPGAFAPVHAFLSAGYSGVTLFFMLSGFILAWNYEDWLGDKLTGRETWLFYVARFARVYPLYLFALALILLTQATSVTGLLKVFTSPTVWLNLAALQTWSPDLNVAYSFNGPSWSIGVEAFLYALFPLLLLAARSTRTDIRKILILIASSAGVAVVVWLAFVVTDHATLPWTDPESAHRWLYRTPLTRIPDFTIGIGLALLLRKIPASTRTQTAGTILTASGLLSATALMATPALLYSAASWDVLYITPAALIILGLAWSPTGLLGRAFSTWLIVLLGDSSYAFYILHVVVLEMVGNKPEHSLGSWLLASTVRYVVICCVAVGAHFLVERPARGALRRLLDRPMGRPAAPRIPNR